MKKTFKTSVTKACAKVFNTAANAAAQTPCWGPHYQPKTPKKLRK